MTVIRHLSCGTVICADRYAATLDARWFERDFWDSHGARRHTTTGRSPVLILHRGPEAWVLRHYRRGGIVARFVDDHYLFTGLARTRVFREWSLLQQLTQWGLPVPAAVAGCVRRRGCLYQADLITRLLPETHTLSSLLRSDGVEAGVWSEIGGMLRRFHDHGVDHPDLTAHNILLDRQLRAYLVDFDNAFVRRPGRWQRSGVARFQRSLRKVALESGTEFSETGWQLLLESYAAAQ